MTQAQKRVLDVIRAHQESSGSMPTQRELAAALGGISQAAVWQMLQRMAAAGLIVLEPGSRNRNIRLPS